MNYVTPMSLSAGTRIRADQSCPEVGPIMRLDSAAVVLVSVLRAVHLLRWICGECLWGMCIFSALLHQPVGCGQGFGNAAELMQ